MTLRHWITSFRLVEDKGENYLIPAPCQPPFHN